MQIDISDRDLFRFRGGYVLPEQPDDCWLWAKSLDSSGYGQFQSKGTYRSRLAHRWSWLIHRGPIPDGIHVLHKCDNRICVNPEHLFLGTQSDNAKDMCDKGRQPRPRPGLNAVRNTKLSQNDVLSIYKDARPAAIVAREYGVSQKTVGNIRYGYRWSWLTHKGENVSELDEAVQAAANHALDVAIATVEKYLEFDSQRAVSWHQVQDCLRALRKLRPASEGANA